MTQNKGAGKKSAAFNANTGNTGTKSSPLKADNDNAQSKDQLIAAIESRLPAFHDGEFQLGEEHIRATANQKTLLDLIDTKDVVFVNGPFGTGKTFWTTLAALRGLSERKYNKISLAAPAVGADEDIGFLPGT